MQLLNISKLPIYLPYDKAPLPFGDPLSNVAFTVATPSVFTVKGYTPTQSDAVQLSVSGGWVLDTNFAVGTRYYVTSIAAATGAFSLTTVANGTPITSYTTAGAVGNTTIHLVSNQMDGVVQPFKSGATVLAMNLGTATVFLEGAPDLNTTTYGNPQGPGTAVLLATLTSGSVALVNLSQDWILTTSAGPGTLALIQN
jgi:hypothetical protein